ncbi:MAG: PHP domain-containing protein [Parachlamydiales bacterium]|nr:PHP domain-containing protein [Parachlamydiales bacterium]
MNHAFRADMHCHTTCSDGTFTPQELLKHAHDRSLQGLSITDHDTVESYLEALPIAESLGIQLVSGVEFSTMHQGVSVHVLAYGFSTENPLILNFCEKHAKRRIERNRAILDRIYKYHSVRITEDDLIQGNKNKGTFGRPHIAQAMVQRGLAISIQDAFHRFLGEGHCCFEPGDTVDVEQTLECIHAANGKAVIAHPHLINNHSIVNQLTEMPFDGIEVYYARFTEVQVKRWKKLAEKKGWFMTGGSDFHGSVKPHNPLGASWAPESTFEFLLKHYQTNLLNVAVS